MQNIIKSEILSKNEQNIFNAVININIMNNKHKKLV